MCLALPSLPFPGAARDYRDNLYSQALQRQSLFTGITKIISFHRHYTDNLFSQGLSSLPSPGAERDYRDYEVIGVIGIIPSQSGRKEFKRVFVDPGGKKAECLFNGIASGEVVEEEVEEEAVETADGKAGSPKLRHPQKS